MLNEEKAVVVFSGGQDSTTCLFWALKNFQEVQAVTFDYGQRHRKEIEVAKTIAHDLGVKHTVLDMSLLNQLAPNALTRKEIEIEQKEGSSLLLLWTVEICYFYRLLRCWQNNRELAILLQEFAKRIFPAIQIAGTFLSNP